MLHVLIRGVDNNRMRRHPFETDELASKGHSNVCQQWRQREGKEDSGEVPVEVKSMSESVSAVQRSGCL